MRKNRHHLIGKAKSIKSKFLECLIYSQTFNMGVVVDKTVLVMRVIKLLVKGD